MSTGLQMPLTVLRCSPRPLSVKPRGVSHPRRATSSSRGDRARGSLGAMNWAGSPRWVKIVVAVIGVYLMIILLIFIAQRAITG